MVSSPTHVRELDLKSSQDLSLHAAAKEILQPKFTYTDHGYEWPDHRGQESVGFNRAVRVLLTNNLSRLLPQLQRVLAAEFDARVEACNNKGNGWTDFPVMNNVQRMIVVLNNVVFFGEEICEWSRRVEEVLATDNDIARNKEVTDALLRYMMLVPVCGELVKIVPEFWAP